MEKLKIGSYDGASLEPAYEPPVTTKAPGKDAIKEYCGSCHCGKVIYKLKSETLTEVTECNCSICSRVWPQKPPASLQAKLTLTECLSLALPAQGECTGSGQGTPTVLSFRHQEGWTFLLHDVRRFGHQSAG